MSRININKWVLGILLPCVSMFMHDHLLATHTNPECAGVAPAHAVEPMESIIDPDLERGLDSLSVSKHSGSIMSGERCFDDCGVGMNVVKADHDFSPVVLQEPIFIFQAP